MEEKTGVQLCRECPADPLERNTQRHRILCCDIIMKTNCNRDQFKRIFSFFAAVLLVGMYAAGFAWVWYESYSSAILLPFYRRGNWVMILIYVVLVLLFAKSFGGLKIGYLKRTDMFYSQTLSIFCVNVVTYFQISVVNRDFSATVPMVLLTIVDLAVLILWIVLTNKLYFRLYPPRKLVVIYGDRNAAELVLKMSRRVDKYMICESVSASAPPEEIREAISRYEGIILCEVSGRLRNDLIKYCFAQNVRAYIAPKISDIILRGAEEIRLFDTPLLLCRNYGLTFEQKLGKRIFDLVFAVVFLVILSPVMLASAIAIMLTKHNLKVMAQTVNLLQEKNLTDEDDLNQRIAELETKYHDALAVVRDLEGRMKFNKELRYHVAAYASTKSVAQQLKTAKRPAAFEEQHRAELTAYRTAAAYFKANNITKLPSPKKLEAEYAQLASEKAKFYEQYKEAKEELFKLKTAKQNVASFFREEEPAQQER